MPSTYYVMGANVAMAIAILLVPNADTDHGQWLAAGRSPVWKLS
jgi:hypothetical protein